MAMKREKFDLREGGLMLLEVVPVQEEVYGLRQEAIELREGGEMFQEIAATFGSEAYNLANPLERMAVLRAVPDEDLVDNRPRVCLGSCCRSDLRLGSLDPEQLAMMREEGELEEFMENGQWFIARRE